MNKIWSDMTDLLTGIWISSGDIVGLRDFLFALAIFAFFTLLKGVFTKIIISRLQILTERSETELDDMLLAALEKPLGFVFIIFGLFFAMQALPLSGLVLELADRGIQSLLVFGIFWALYEAVDPLTLSIGKIENILTTEIVDWMASVMRWSIIGFGLATLLQLWGIQVAPIIAGFGLFGVAVALGAQDLFKNLLAGLSILLEQRFRVGDWVSVDGVVEGTVEHIGFRSTRVRRFDKAPVTVPNNIFSDHAVVNFSAMTNRRIYWRIGIVYSASSEQLMGIQKGIEAWLHAHDGFVNPPELPCHIFIDSFNDSSIDMLIYTFTRTTDWREWLKLKQELALAIKDIVEAQGSGFAFPSRSLYIETGSSQIEDIGR